MISRFKLFRISVATATTAVVALVVVASIVYFQQPVASADVNPLFTPRALISATTMTRNASSSATDPASYKTTNPLTGWQDNFTSLINVTVLEPKAYPGRYILQFSYLDTNRNMVYSAPSSSFTWVKDARGNNIGVHAVAYYGMHMGTLDIRPGTNPLTGAATKVVTLKDTSTTGRVVYFNVVGYFTGDRNNTVFR